MDPPDTPGGVSVVCWNEFWLFTSLCKSSIPIEHINNLQIALKLCWILNDSESGYLNFFSIEHPPKEGQKRVKFLKRFQRWWNETCEIFPLCVNVYRDTMDLIHFWCSNHNLRLFWCLHRSMQWACNVLFLLLLVITKAKLF